MGNAIRFYVVLARGEISSSLPVPLSLLIAAALATILAAHFRPPQDNCSAFAIAFLAAGLLFPLAQISLFGMTDYRRPADLIVVFGAKAYPNGVASPTLADRVRTGCELYRAGLAPRLLFSGGPGEPEAMQRLARTLGVPDAAVIRDPLGVNTESTVRNTMPLAARRILAVSHFYHLPRIKMTYQRYGVDVYTVPSIDTVPWQMPFNLVREDVAFWAYYLRRFDPSRNRVR
jgi:uncharacterized SAM-binding protein YcdF (DUF218 family)